MSAAHGLMPDRAVPCDVRFGAGAGGSGERPAHPVGLVLEGGGMRGAYTAGVLDAFMDGGIDIPYVIGVSAGANAGSNYVSGQRERNHRVFVDLAGDRRYAGVARLLAERSWFGMTFLFETIPGRLVPFDYTAFRDSTRLFTVCVTDCRTGKPMYVQQRDRDPRDFVARVMRASSSIPVLSPPVAIDGRPCCDGGVSDPIPIERSISDGNRLNVVVLTRNAGFRRGPQRLGLLARRVLAPYPRVREQLARRHERYNYCLERIEALEHAGEAFVFRPEQPLSVGRMERDAAKLDALYRQGHAEALERVGELHRWQRGGSPVVD